MEREAANRAARGISGVFAVKPLAKAIGCSLSRGGGKGSSRSFTFRFVAASPTHRIKGT